MKKIKIVVGITWAFACLILIVILFPALNSFSASAAKLPFMKINPNYTGGSIAKEFVNEGCTLTIRKPVFDGLIGERNNGFVQLDWRGNIPEKIYDTIDYNLDRIADFCVLVDRKKPNAELVTSDKKVKKIGISTQTSYGWSVRVELTK